MRARKSKPAIPVWVKTGLLLSLAASGCGGDGIFGSDGDNRRPAEIVRERIEALAPAADIGHRGLGETRSESLFPENSIPAFLEAVKEGADGIELDVELTADGALAVMHDDTVDRTTSCTGCVSAHAMADLATCRLLDGQGLPTLEVVPTLGQVLAAVAGPTFVNLELKVTEEACRTQTSGPEELARAATAEVARLGVAGRTIFSSFDETAASAVKQNDPDLYSALLVDWTRSLAWKASVSRAIALGLDAIHPYFLIPAEGVRAAREGGLQVNVWTVDEEAVMNRSLDKGVTGIITDDPDLLRKVIEGRR